MSRVGNGISEVEIGGQEYTLKVTIKAIESIEQRFGSFADAAQACMKMNLGVAAFIISQAADLNKDQSRKLKGQLVQEGLQSAMTISAEYLAMVINPNDDEDDEDGEPGER